MPGPVNVPARPRRWRTASERTASVGTRRWWRRACRCRCPSNSRPASSTRSSAGRGSLKCSTRSFPTRELLQTYPKPSGTGSPLTPANSRWPTRRSPAAGRPGPRARSCKPTSTSSSGSTRPGASACRPCKPFGTGPAPRPTAQARPRRDSRSPSLGASCRTAPRSLRPMPPSRPIPAACGRGWPQSTAAARPATRRRSLGSPSIRPPSTTSRRFRGCASCTSRTTTVSSSTARSPPPNGACSGCAATSG